MYKQLPEPMELSTESTLLNLRCRSSVILSLGIALLLFAIGTTVSAESDKVQVKYAQKAQSQPAGQARSAVPGLAIGNTDTDFQKNGSMNRQIGTRGPGHILYFSWMDSPNASDDRTIDFNSYDPSTGVLSQGSVGATVSGTNSGYVTMDMKASGGPIMANHHNAGTTSPWVSAELVPGVFFSSEMDPSVYAAFTKHPGDVFIWPRIAYTDVAIDTPVTHILAHNNPGTSDTDKVLLYVRKVGETFSGTWDTPIVIDTSASFFASSVVTASRQSERVAIAWVGGRGDGTPGGAPVSRIKSGTGAARAFDTDLYVMISEDAGATWTRQNLTMRPDSLSGGFSPHRKLTALWDSSDKLHVVWTEYRWVGYGGIFYRGPGRLEHWDELSASTSVIHTADWVADETDCFPGVFDLNVTNPQLSECNGNLYVTYTQFNQGPGGIIDDCGSHIVGGTNADIALVVSSDGGATWDAPRNLTQTYTPGCGGGIGDPCDSEAWHSTTRYGIDISGEDFALIPDFSANIGGYAGNDYLFVQFIEDLDPGTYLFSEGFRTLNRVKVFRFGCVEPIDPATDIDADGVPNGADNCPSTYNPLQDDSDTDGAGDVCDICPGFDDALDADADGVPDGCDICPGFDDLADNDSDLVPDSCDNCPDDFNPLQEDGDMDGFGDVCDEPDCPIVLTGDVNVSATITSADIIFMVGYVFKSGADPLPCVASGDVNCSGTVTSADIIYLVGFVFKSAAPPCDACADSPLAGDC